MKQGVSRDAMKKGVSLERSGISHDPPPGTKIEPNRIAARMKNHKDEKDFYREV